MVQYHYNRDKGRVENWPDLFYGPEGEEKLFFSMKEVPEGWTTKKPVKVFNPAPPVLDHDELVAQLNKMGVLINPIWGDAHMKRIIDGDVSSAW